MSPAKEKPTKIVIKIYESNNRNQFVKGARSREVSVSGKTFDSIMKRVEKLAGET